jgi:drug/metabolite transporter (DMT)-like permease
MSETHGGTTTLDPLPSVPGPTEAEAHRAAAALLVATVLWGCGFTWAKAAGEAVHRAVGLPDGSTFGPIFVLAWRFALAGLAVLILVPRARRGWTWRGAGRIAFTGLLLAAGLVLQHTGLDRTDEAVSAFLTSLTILFVPMILTVALRKPPAPVMWLGVLIATGGVWLMTGATAKGFGVGEALGLACAFTFSLYVLAVNAVAKTEDAWRMTAGQFLVVGLACLLACAAVEGNHALRPDLGLGLLRSNSAIWRNIALLTLFPTIGAFSLLNHFQPKLDPTRAALIYLMEPVVAAAYAWAMVGRALGLMTLAGAALILVANVLVELLAARSQRNAADAAATDAAATDAAATDAAATDAAATDAAATAPASSPR